MSEGIVELNLEFTNFKNMHIIPSSVQKLSLQNIPKISSLMFKQIKSLDLKFSERTDFKSNYFYNLEELQKLTLTNCTLKKSNCEALNFLPNLRSVKLTKVALNGNLNNLKMFTAIDCTFYGAC